VKLPEDAVVPDDKLLRYLLLPREENDKSAFLAIAGYTLATWEVLRRDLQELARFYEVTDTITSPYGIKHEIRGALTGPNGQTLDIVTVWITLEATGGTRFVTLFPDKEVAR
jgi:Domain of unknown function (DUF6883)